MVAKLGLWWKNLLKKWSKYKTINWAYHDSRLQTSYFNGPIPASFINFSLYYKKLTVSSIKVAYDWIRTEVLSQPMPNMPTSYPVFVDVVDGPRGSHLLILTLPLAWCAIAVTLVWQEVPKTVKWSIRIITLKPVILVNILRNKILPYSANSFMPSMGKGDPDGRRKFKFAMGQKWSEILLWVYLKSL